ncbi:uncharacterized protein B0I36DRAFT_392442 [Microdochium trichocladiopsis]|uniref:Uncharacterized protein n=1 Tax=Microdochium trichocladiopsis TaxID=1682393 RepID=A0A9P9BUY2_9PEZI|nr:uncharacterized protein B0I36DRAFT_392442 [Microdochium trichocladiopsis]KAH7041456.1 hypothetical protein B0I36DRAFT_392442 [Microdochium trichocladiopsis]
MQAWVVRVVGATASLERNTAPAHSYTFDTRDISPAGLAGSLSSGHDKDSTLLVSVCGWSETTSVGTHLRCTVVRGASTEHTIAVLSAPIGVDTLDTIRPFVNHLAGWTQARGRARVVLCGSAYACPSAHAGGTWPAGALHNAVARIERIKDVRRALYPQGDEWHYRH